jgi:hypothetical protein
LTLLDLAVERLRLEFETQGKPGDFEALKDCLTAARGGIDYATMGVVDPSGGCDEVPHWHAARADPGMERRDASVGESCYGEALFLVPGAEILLEQPLFW